MKCERCGTEWDGERCKGCGLKTQGTDLCNEHHDAGETQADWEKDYEESRRELTPEENEGVLADIGTCDLCGAHHEIGRGDNYEQAPDPHDDLWLCLKCADLPELEVEKMLTSKYGRYCDNPEDCGQPMVGNCIGCPHEKKTDE
jgi:hypothetical protein